MKYSYIFRRINHILCYENKIQLGSWQVKLYFWESLQDGDLLTVEKMHNPDVE